MTLSSSGELNRALAERAVLGEICLFVGSVMVLAFNARLSTKDVGAHHPPEQVPVKARFLVESLFEEGRV